MSFVIVGAIAGVAAVGVGVYGAVSSANAASEQADYQKRQAEINAGYAEQAAQDAIKRGEISVGNIREQGRKVIGSQKVGFASQGIDLSSGSVQDVAKDTQAAIEKDVMTTRNNALRDAWGYRTSGLNYRSQGELAQQAGSNERRNTLLLGGAQAASGIASIAQGLSRK